MAEIAIAEIETGEAAEHQPVTLERRFIEAIERAKLRDLLRIHAGMHAHAKARALLAAPQFMHGLFNRSPGHELDHGERQREDAEQGRDHQQDSFEDVAPHGRGPLE